MVIYVTCGLLGVSSVVGSGVMLVFLVKKILKHTLFKQSISSQSMRFCQCPLTGESESGSRQGVFNRIFHETEHVLLRAPEGPHVNRPQ